MKYRELGRTGIEVSELGFGGWAIGGQAYGRVDRNDALRALAVAEELGCNFVDTAGVYGASEEILGEFLAGRPHRWRVATKFSGQEAGLGSTVEAQLRRLRLETIDFYQLHWVPPEHDGLYEELDRLKAKGMVRATGVSLYNRAEVRRVLARVGMDGFQVAFSLLDPEPFITSREIVRARGAGVVVRSALKSGFLSGKFRAGVRFPDGTDQRRQMNLAEVDSIVEAVERFRFLESPDRPLLLAAARYPLAFPEVSTVLLGTKNEAQARVNFGEVPAGSLESSTLDAIRAVQEDLGLFDRRPRILSAFIRLARRALGR